MTAISHYESGGDMNNSTMKIDIFCFPLQNKEQSWRVEYRLKTKAL
jgi:hypothetical protein